MGLDLSLFLNVRFTQGAVVHSPFTSHSLHSRGKTLYFRLKHWIDSWRGGARTQCGSPRLAALHIGLLTSQCVCLRYSKVTQL